MTTPAQQLAAIVQPSLDKLSTDVKATIENRQTEILAAIEGINTRLTLIEKLVAGQKKKATSKKAESDGVNSVASAAEPAEVKPQKVAFPNNAMLYFRRQFIDDAEFTKRYTTPELTKILETDASITSATEKSKPTKKKQAAWAYVRANTELHALVKEEYAAAKVAFGAAKTEEKVEAATP